MLVGVPGLEPGKAGPESAVLPLHHTPIKGLRKLRFANTGAKVRLLADWANFFPTFFSKKQLSEQQERAMTYTLACVRQS